MKRNAGLSRVRSSAKFFKKMPTSLQAINTLLTYGGKEVKSGRN